MARQNKTRIFISQLKYMATKKVTTKTASQPKPKYYIVMDDNQNIICQGEWWEVKDALEEHYMDGDDSDQEFIASLTIYELGVGKKLKFIPAIPASVSL